MTISKKLTALFAGLLLVGSFGLAGCDDSGSGSSAGSNGSSSNSTTTENPDAPSGIPQDPRCELKPNDGEKWRQDDDGYDIKCFGDSGVRIPFWKNADHSIETYEKYKYYFDTYCYEDRNISGDIIFECVSQNPDRTARWDLEANK